MPSTEHTASFVQKIFVINFITSYLGIFLTAFVYVPFAKILVPYLDVFQLTTQFFTTSAGGDGDEKPVTPLTQNWQLNPDRLTKQVIYFTVTAQIVNFAIEVIVPYVKRKLFSTVAKVQSELASPSSPKRAAKDHPDEAAFLKRVRTQADLEEYDVTIDYREMVIQFGYLSLFSVVWPLTACSFLINNWVEARSDAVKIATNCQRPIPWRADSIGPWLNALGFLSWLGSITSAALVYLFRAAGREGDILSSAQGWALLLSILFSEHLYLAIQLVVRGLVKRLDSPGLQKEKAERFAMRKQMLERMATAAGGDPLFSGRSEKVAEEQLEEEVAEVAFWTRQRGVEDTINVGRTLIAEVSSFPQ